MERWWSWRVESAGTRAEVPVRVISSQFRRATLLNDFQRTQDRQGCAVGIDPALVGGIVRDGVHQATASASALASLNLAAFRA